MVVLGVSMLRPPKRRRWRASARRGRSRAGLRRVARGAVGARLPFALALSAFGGLAVADVAGPPELVGLVRTPGASRSLAVACRSAGSASSASCRSILLTLAPVGDRVDRADGPGLAPLPLAASGGRVARARWQAARCRDERCGDAVRAAAAAARERGALRAADPDTGSAHARASAPARSTWCLPPRGSTAVGSQSLVQHQGPPYREADHEPDARDHRRGHEARRVADAACSCGARSSRSPRVAAGSSCSRVATG